MNKEQQKRDLEQNISRDDFFSKVERNYLRKKQPEAIDAQKKVALKEAIDEKYNIGKKIALYQNTPGSMRTKVTAAGFTGESLAIAQLYLGLSKISIDGIFGKGSHQALMNYQGPLPQIDEGDNNEEVEIVPNSDLIKGEYLNKYGSFNEKVGPKRLDQIIKVSPLPETIKLHISERNTMNPGFQRGVYVVTLIAGKYYFQKNTRIRAKILPGDKVTKIVETGDGSGGNNNGTGESPSVGNNNGTDGNPSLGNSTEEPPSNPDTAEGLKDLLKIKGLILSSEILKDLESTHSKLPFLLLYLSKNPYTFTFGDRKIKHTLHFSPQEKNVNINLLSGILKTQEQFPGTRSSCIKKYEENLNDMIEKPDNISKVFFICVTESEDPMFPEGAFGNLPEYEKILKDRYSNMEDLSSDKTAESPQEIVSHVKKYCKDNPGEKVLFSINLHGGPGGEMGYGNGDFTKKHLQQLKGLSNLVLSIDCCFGGKQLDIGDMGTTEVFISSDNQTATYDSTKCVLDAYKGIWGLEQGNYDGVNGVSFFEARLHQILNYNDSIVISHISDVDDGYVLLSDTSVGSIEPNKAIGIINDELNNNPFDINNSLLEELLNDSTSFGSLNFGHQKNDNK